MLKLTTNQQLTLLLDAYAASTEIYTQGTEVVTGLQLHSRSSISHTIRRKEAKTKYKPRYNPT